MTSLALWVTYAALGAVLLSNIATVALLGVHLRRSSRAEKRLQAALKARFEAIERTERLQDRRYERIIESLDHLDALTPRPKAPAPGSHVILPLSTVANPLLAQANGHAGAGEELRVDSKPERRARTYSELVQLAKDA